MIPIATFRRGEYRLLVTLSRLLPLNKLDPCLTIPSTTNFSGAHSISLASVLDSRRRIRALGL